MSRKSDRNVLPFAQGVGVVLAGLTLASSAWAQNPAETPPPKAPAAAPKAPAAAPKAPAAPPKAPAPAQPNQPAPGEAAAPAPATAPAEPPAAAEAPKEPAAEAPGTDAAASVPPALEPSAEQTPPPDESAPADDTVVETGSGLFEDSTSGNMEVADESAAGGVAPSKTYDLNGYMRGDFFVGKLEDDSRGEIKAGYGELALKLTALRQRYGDAFAEARLRYGEQTERHELFIDLREAYVNAYLGPVDLRLGQQIIVWGRADAFNPTNNITPFDLRVRSPNEDDRRVANVGARMFINFEPVRLEGVWMPFYKPSELPPFQFDERIVFVDNYPDTRFFENGLEAGRVHLELPSFEASVSYLYGYNHLPGYRWVDYQLRDTDPDTGDDIPAQVVVERKPYQHQVFGLDFSTALGDFMALRGEAAYRIPKDYKNTQNAPHPDIQYVLGADKTFGPVSVIAQYVGRYTLDWQRETGAGGGGIEELDATDAATRFGGPLGEAEVEERLDDELRYRNQIVFQQTKELQHMISLRVEWLTLHDTLSLSALGGWNISTEEWLLYPKIAYQLSDGMSATLGGEIYAGPTGTLLGLIDEKLSAGYGELKFSF